MLHNDEELFEQVVIRVSSETGIDVEIIEKDYFVTLFLKKIAELQPDIIFKGGTSLSKCYKIIERFSEDIDLSIETDDKPTEGQRRLLKENIVSIVEELGFILENHEDIKSRRNYNRYIVEYPSAFISGYLKESLIIETSVHIKSYPCKKMSAASIIYDYLNKNGYDNLIEEYGLESFEIKVQTAERTLIDKLYALGDYYLSNMIQEHSRHIYDIHKLCEIVAVGEKMKLLIKDIYEERKRHKQCRSAKDEIDMNFLLQEIIDKAIYKKDYEDITEKMLFEECSYNTAIRSLQKIVDCRLF